jgi:hypothetical protein
MKEPSLSRRCWGFDLDQTHDQERWSWVDAGERAPTAGRRGRSLAGIAVGDAVVAAAGLADALRQEKLVRGAMVTGFEKPWWP